MSLLSSLFSARKSKTSLYSEGVRLENAGSYQAALDNYEDALKETGQLKPDRKFSQKIEQRIKTVRATMDYENRFNRPK